MHDSNTHILYCYCNFSSNFDFSDNCCTTLAANTHISLSVSRIFLCAAFFSLFCTSIALFMISGTNPMDMSARVMHPSGENEDVVLSEVSEGNYVVKFTPKEVGLHTVSVMHQQNHVCGSPFQFTVGNMSDFGSHRVFFNSFVCFKTAFQWTKAG